MTAYVRTAPQDLIALHQNKQVGKSYRYLTFLLTDPEMEQAWAELEKHRRRDDHACRLFSEIVNILHAIRRHAVVRRRTDERDHYQRVADHAANLAAAVMNGPLDRLAYEYFYEEDMHINGVNEWDALDPLERVGFAHALLPRWTSLVELLGQLEKKARRLAEEAMRNPRLVDRQLSAEDYRQLYFVRALARYMTVEYGSPLYGTVAHIANAVLDTTFTKAEIAKKVGGPSKAE